MGFRGMSQSQRKSIDKEKNSASTEDTKTPRRLESQRRILMLIVKQIKNVSCSGWLYFISLILLLISIGWQMNTQLVLEFTDSQSANAVVRAHGILSLLWLSGNIAVATYLRGGESILEKASAAPEDEKPFELDVQFLLGRADNLDRVVHYLRSGISIMAGVFTAAIIWLLDRQRELTNVESVFITISAILVFFSIVAILFSFGDTSVYSHGKLLDEDLVPQGQSESVYKQQLTTVVTLKLRVITRMKTMVGLGLVVFVMFGGILSLSPIYQNQGLSGYLVVNFMETVSTLLMIFLFFFFAFAVVRMLGIISPYEIEENG